MVGKKPQKVEVIGLFVEQIAAVYTPVVNVVRAPKLKLFHCSLLQDLTGLLNTFSIRSFGITNLLH
jgi:hypothetical protein